MSSPPAKRKKHVDSKYQAEWSRFKMASSKKGPLFAFCTVCNSDIAGGGVYDVKRHCDGVKHKKSLQYGSAQPSISSLMNSASKESLSSKVLKSEVFLAKFVAEHNLSFSTADHFTKLCKKLFPDSKKKKKKKEVTSQRSSPVLARKPLPSLPMR